MKKIITTLMFSAVYGLINCANAQSPVLTGATTNMQPGESFTGHGVNYVLPGSSGVNQTWNFSGITSIGTSSFTCVTPGSTPHATDFTTSSVSTNQSGIYNYYNGNSSELQIDGYAYPSMFIAFSNPEIILTYPCSFNNTFTDAFAATYTSGANTVNRIGTVTVTADGYGTLILPNGTVNNVLRVLTVESYADSIGANPYSQATTTTYSWYLPGIHYAVFALNTVSVNGTIVNQSGQYLDQITTGIQQPIQYNMEATIYPNPFTSQVNISFQTNLTNATLTIYNLQGQIMTEMKNINGQLITLSRNNLQAGQYFINVTQDSKTIVKKNLIIAD